jgi:hypothetical protein
MLNEISSEHVLPFQTMSAIETIQVDLRSVGY